MSLYPVRLLVRLLVRGLTLALVGAALLLLSGVADHPAMRPVAVKPNDPEFLGQWNLHSGVPGAIHADDAWDGEWEFVANQDEHGYAYPYDARTGADIGPLLVRYGTKGYFGPDRWTYKLLSGDFVCSVATFDGVDPAFGDRKRCEVDDNWIKAVSEGERVPVSPGVATWVRYGIADKWGYAQIDRPATCGVGLVGFDPAYMKDKICQIQSRAWGGVAATEGGSFTIPAAVPGSPQPTDRGAVVRYGAGASWVYKLLRPGTTGTCDVAFFGQGDPSYFTRKHCEIVTTMGTGVTIAVVDYGSVPNPDLDGKLVPGLNFADRTKSNQDDCPPGSKTRDHGLAVAGTAAATTFNGIGIAGVAPMAKVAQLKIANGCDGAWSRQGYADAIRWAAGLPVPESPPNANPARVIVITSAVSFQPCVWPVKDAVAAARAAGAYLVAAAGNQGEDLSMRDDLPVDCPGVAPVAGIDSKGRKWSDSNFGVSVHLSAPSVGIPTLSTPNYELKNGTSLAAPQVGGVAALMFGKNPALTQDNVSFRLQLSSRAFPYGCDGCGMGLLDADRAMRSAEAITTETEDNDDYDKANYISASADIKGSLVPKLGWASLCTVSQPCCKNATGPSCPQPKTLPDQDWFTLMLPPNQTLSAWIHKPAQCATDCYFDIRPIGGGPQTYAFGAAATYTNTGTIHQAVNIRIHSLNKAVLADYQLNVMWRDERRAGGQVIPVPVERLELR